MYKNFNLTDAERQEIFEMHQEAGYKQSLNEQIAPPSVAPPNRPSVGTRPTAPKPANNKPSAIPKPSVKLDEPSVKEPDNTTTDVTKSNINQTSKLIGKRATFYTNPEDAYAAYSAQKSDSQSPGSLIAKIVKITAVDNNTVQLFVEPQQMMTQYTKTNGYAIFVFNRETSVFTLAGDNKNYYSETVKQILLEEFFTTELASNGNGQQANDMAEDSSESTGNLNFDEYEYKSLKERGFKFNMSNTSATYKHPTMGTIGVTKSKKYANKEYGGYVITRNGQVYTDSPHDFCDTALDKLLGYDSLRGGYPKNLNEAQIILKTIFDKLK